MINKLESLQKQCIKWILSEEFYSYTSNEVYLRKCREVRILPLVKRFDYNDLVLFYKIIYDLVPLKLPHYLKFYDGSSRLRTCHLDNLSLISSLKPKSNSVSETNKNCALYKSFYYRVHLQWNLLPLDIRAISSLSKFKTEVLKFFWKLILDDTDHFDCLEEEDLCDTFQ